MTQHASRSPRWTGLAAGALAVCVRHLGILRVSVHVRVRVRVRVHVRMRVCRWVQVYMCVCVGLCMGW